MTPLCIHGFRTAQCASCRDCRHGTPISRCSRCRAEAAAPSPSSRRRPIPVQVQEPAVETHNGFEILFAPAVNGWLYRGPDAPVSRESFRSVFLTRKAIDNLGSASVASPPATAPRRKKKK
jgi:hypothetical protein